jgi:capsule polysaccharide export protein KpsE/RkpR
MSNLPSVEAKPAEPRVSGLRQWRARARHHRSFLVACVVPSLLAIIYFGVIASDHYVSESRFTIREWRQVGSTQAGDPLKIITGARADDEVLALHEFLRGRDALRLLDAATGFGKLYGSPRVDFINRFGGLLGRGEGLDALHAHYLQHVSVDYDAKSRVSVLRVKGYAPEDVWRINAALVDMAEKFLNENSQRRHRELLKAAERNLLAAEERLRRASEAVRASSLPRQGQGANGPDTLERLRAEERLAQLHRQGVAAAFSAAHGEAAGGPPVLERVVQPNRPDAAAGPQRLRGILTVVVVSLMLWGIGALIVASVREHGE